MCISPGIDPFTGRKYACRNCWQCEANYINDWVGRSIAEIETSAAAHSLTLTYSDDHGSDNPEAHLKLHYPDIQRFLKRVRFHGFPCRYLAVGEYGSGTKRAHWHVLLFWQDAARVPLQAERLEQLLKDWNVPGAPVLWPHGFQWWRAANHDGVRYVCKYMLKDAAAKEAWRNELARLRAERVTQDPPESRVLGERKKFKLFRNPDRVRMSTNPPLGAKYFELLAGRYVQQGLAPQDGFYSFTDVRDSKGRIRQFMLTGQSLRLFCLSFIEQWTAVRGDHYPSSEIVERFEDEYYRRSWPGRVITDPVLAKVKRPWTKTDDAEKKDELRNDSSRTDPHIYRNKRDGLP